MRAVFGWRGRLAAFALIALLAVPASAFGSDAADAPIFDPVAVDGSQVVINGTDIYQRQGDQLIADGSTRDQLPPDASIQGTYGDGSVFFTTAASLVPDDTDGQLDLYRLSNGAFDLISAGPGGTDANFDQSRKCVSHFEHALLVWICNPSPTAVSEDGSRAVFSTADALVPQDTDSSYDLYEWHNGQVSLVSTGPDGGNGPFDADKYCTPVTGPGGFPPDPPIDSDQCVREAPSISSDGLLIAFRTKESLVATDTDTSNDIYARVGGTTYLVSAGTTDTDPQLIGAFGNHVFFYASGLLNEWSPADGGEQFVSSAFLGASANGDRSFFYSAAQLLPDDPDTASGDIYEQTPDGLVLVSTGPSRAPAGSSTNTGVLTTPFAFTSDGSRVFFRSRTALTPNAPASDSLYENHDGTTTLLSPPGPLGKWDVKASKAGDGVFSVTDRALVPEDTDGSADDVYELDGNGQYHLISVAPDGWNQASEVTSSTDSLVLSRDGSRVLFSMARKTPYGQTPPRQVLHLDGESIPLGAQDTTPPETQVISADSPIVKGGSSTFRYTAGETAHFECRIDAGDWIPCNFESDPGTFTYSHTAFFPDVGEHTFEVRATDTSGNTDPTPASRQIKVKAPDTNPPPVHSRNAPTTTIDPGRFFLTRNPRPSFSFGSDQGRASFHCFIDDGLEHICSSHFRPDRSLTDGVHELTVTSKSRLGVFDPSPAHVRFRVNGGVVATMSANLRQNVVAAGGLVLFARCPAENCRVRLSARSNIAEAPPLRAVHAHLAAGSDRRFKLRIGPRLGRLISERIAQGRPVLFRALLVARDHFGNVFRTRYIAPRGASRHQALFDSIHSAKSGSVVR